MENETSWMPLGGEGGIFFVDTSKINLQDLLHANPPGAIVRCRGLPAVQYVPPLLEDYNRVAGMISDGT